MIRTAKAQKNGGSDTFVVITIPADIAKFLKIKPKDTVVFEVEKGKVIIKKGT